jgi:hypothetical protein
MATFTVSHRLETPLADVLDRLKNAKRVLRQDKTFRSLISNFRGSTSTTEITWSPVKGWHPHQHDAWFLFPETDLDNLQIRIFDRWQSACERNGLVTKFTDKAGKKKIGLDVRVALSPSDYLTKFDRERSWSLPAEMTAGRLKTSRGSSLTPWAILEAAILEGPESYAAELWVEFCRATKGKSCVSLKGAATLANAANIDLNLRDFAIANQNGDAEVIGQLTPQEFDRLMRAGGLGSFLEAARKNIFSKTQT